MYAFLMDVITREIVRELVGRLVEDASADAVVVAWTRTDKGKTTLHHEALGNQYATMGIAGDLLALLTLINEEEEEPEGESGA